MRLKTLKSLDDIKRYGRKFEKQRDLDDRCTAPPLKNKCRNPVAAYEGTTNLSARTRARVNNEAAAVGKNPSSSES